MKQFVYTDGYCRQDKKYFAFLEEGWGRGTPHIIKKAESLLFATPSPVRTYGL